jgi:hypothetical protein
LEVWLASLLELFMSSPLVFISPKSYIASPKKNTGEVHSRTGLLIGQSLIKVHPVFVLLDQKIGLSSSSDGSLSVRRASQDSLVVGSKHKNHLRQIHFGFIIPEQEISGMSM